MRADPTPCLRTISVNCFIVPLDSQKNRPWPLLCATPEAVDGALAESQAAVCFHPWFLRCCELKMTPSWRSHHVWRKSPGVRVALCHEVLQVEDQDVQAALERLLISATDQLPTVFSQLVDHG